MIGGIPGKNGKKSKKPVKREVFDDAKVFGYELNEDDYEYLCDLRAMLIDGQSSACMVCGDYQFGVYALGERLEVYRFSEKLAVFDHFEDFVCHFIVNEKPLIEQVGSLDFDE